jgi:hypothetical protein
MAGESADPRLTPAEVDLAAIAAAQRVDRYLVELASLADSDIDTVVGLVLNGAVIVGRIVSPEAMARTIDEHLLTLLEMSATASSETQAWEDLKDAVSGENVRRVHEDRKARRDMIERHNALCGEERVPPSEMPEDLARAVIADNARVVMTLADAKVFPPGTREPLDVAVMRVDIRQVGAWWMVPADAQTRLATFSFPERS